MDSLASLSFSSPVDVDNFLASIAKAQIPDRYDESKSLQTFVVETVENLKQAVHLSSGQPALVRIHAFMLRLHTLISDIVVSQETFQALIRDSLRDHGHAFTFANQTNFGKAIVYLEKCSPNAEEINRTSSQFLVDYEELIQLSNEVLSAASTNAKKAQESNEKIRNVIHCIEKLNQYFQTLSVHSRELSGSIQCFVSVVESNETDPIKLLSAIADNAASWLLLLRSSFITTQSLSSIVGEFKLVIDKVKV